MVGSAITCSVVIPLVRELTLFPFLPCWVVDNRRTVTEIMIYMPVSSFPERVEEDGEVMEDFPSRNIMMCAPTSNCLIQKRKSRKMNVWKAFTW